MTKLRAVVAIEPIAAQDRAWVRAYLQAHWGGPQVVTRGVIHQADALPGFIAGMNGAPVGLLTYHLAGRVCEVVSLDADVEGRGIGSALLDAARRAAVAQGCTRIRLITTNDNTDAIRFYQKRGYALAAVHRCAVEQARALKPSIPEIGRHGIPIRDEIELELILRRDSFGLPV